MTALPASVKYGLENTLGNTGSTSDAMSVKMEQKILIL